MAGQLNKIGEWSVDKLEIVKAYSEEYARILKSQETRQGKKRFRFGYIDGFAGAGEHIRKQTGQIVSGSPLNALNLTHRFDEYHFIDLDPARVERLRQKCDGFPGVYLHHGDCNEVVLDVIFPEFKYADYRRALCLLDPYGMHLNWQVLAKAGEMKSIEVFLNFPIMDMNRNAKRRTLDQVDPIHRKRMTDFWGDESWHQAMFQPSTQTNFFGQLGGRSEEVIEMEGSDNEAFVAAFQERLRRVAGFQFVPEPVPMKIPSGPVVYYLFFAGNNETGNRIANHIFTSYRESSRR